MCPSQSANIIPSNELKLCKCSPSDEVKQPRKPLHPFELRVVIIMISDSHASQAINCSFAGLSGLFQSLECDANATLRCSLWTSYKPRETCYT